MRPLLGIGLGLVALIASFGCGSKASPPPTSTPSKEPDAAAALAPDGGSFAISGTINLADGTVSPAGEKPSLVGKPAPALDGKLVKGKGTVSLAGLKGKPVVVVFWATWSPPTVEALKDVDALVAKHAKEHVAAIAVSNDDDPKDVERFLKDGKIAIPVVSNPEHKLDKTWTVESLPAVFFVDKSGVVRAELRGATDPKPSYEKELEKAL